MRTSTTLLSLSATLSALSAQNFVVVPRRVYHHRRGSATSGSPAASDPQRQQTLIGASHLQSMIGHPITALEFRRTAVVEAYQAGSMNLTVTLSTSSSNPMAPSSYYANNIGADALQVFQGTVQLPASPATGPTQTPVAWTSSNTVRIVFATPFVYQGGTLVRRHHRRADRGARDVVDGGRGRKK